MVFMQLKTFLKFPFWKMTQEIRWNYYITAKNFFEVYCLTLSVKELTKPKKLMLTLCTKVYKAYKKGNHASQVC